MEAHKCDHCGKFFTSGGVFIKRYFPHDAGTQPHFDLCQECFDKAMSVLRKETF